ncbi:hypothetical protein AN219_05845 [Streptomyces nanshensis]|nr:hypothetical protein AN219_05845 [Streptomyces nanshensis]
MICISALLATGWGSTALQAAVPGQVSDGGSPRTNGERSATPELAVTRGGSGSAKVSRPSADGRPTSRTERDVTLSSYDAKAGRAVLTHGGTRAPGIRKGDVIASPPAAAAPAGALVKVTRVRSESAGRTEVATAPAKLADVLGSSKAEGKIPVAPSAWDVTPQLKSLDVTRGIAGRAQENSARGIGGGADGRKLRIEFGTELPMFGGKPGLERETKVGGFLEMAPSVGFSYDGKGSADPADASASVNVSGPWKAGWRIKGPVKLPRTAPRIPIATLAAYPVVMVGTVPVVVALKLSLVLEVRADGTLNVDVDQTSGGSMKVGTRHTEAAGWKPDRHADGKTRTGGTAKVSGNGELRTMLGPEASISLYDTVGVDAFFGPYLRAKARQPKSASTAGEKRGGTWKLNGGVTLETSLFAGLPFTVIGIRPQDRVVFPVVTREWPIADGRIPPGA